MMLFINLHASFVFAQIHIPTVTIGDPGNPGTIPPPFSSISYGSVAYTYNIGQTEVTNAQYAAFLNAVARTDTHNLYTTSMDGYFGGIRRSGGSGSYTYTTITGRENNPVIYVDFWDAARFANWLHNGQPTGMQDNSTTEDGAYTLTPSSITANTVTRNAGWQWAVCNQNEWYKAAYYQPATQGGDADGYWRYATSSNTITTNDANYGSLVDYFTPVGSYAPNYYGVYDMVGNAFEWIEDFRVDAQIMQSYRGLLGSDFSTGVNAIDAYGPSFQSPWYQYLSVGFRVTQIPGPSSGALLGFGLFQITRRVSPRSRRLVASKFAFVT